MRGAVAENVIVAAHDGNGDNSASADSKPVSTFILYLICYDHPLELFYFVATE